jgi:hypothetical protein
LRHPNWQRSCLLAAVALLAGAGGAGASYLYEHSACPALPLRMQDFICLTNDTKPPVLTALEGEIHRLLEGKEGAGKLMRAGVLFQRLNDGFGFSIGDEQLFVPASLLKLPVAFAVLMLDAEQPGTLAQELPYTIEQATGCTVLSQEEVSASGLVLGQRYTLDSMLRAVIVHSDNLSYCILIGHMNAQSDRRALLQRTFRELGIRDPETVQHEAASVREYGALFRLLYNTAYLDAAGSAKLLGWLSESSYAKGIEAGVPSGIRVANKFAERVTSDDTRYLHDCGIVYVEDEPYVLCVMTKGLNFVALREVISEVSSTIHSAVTTGRRWSSGSVTSMRRPRGPSSDVDTASAPPSMRTRSRSPTRSTSRSSVCASSIAPSFWTRIRN